MDDELARTFGQRVRFARQGNRQTQSVVAGLSGITTDYLYQIERGKKLPALPVAVELARVLRVPLSTLLGETPTGGPAVPPLEAGAAIHQAMTWASPAQTSLDVTNLHRQVESAWGTWQSSERRYSQLGRELPTLVTATEQLRRTTDETDAVLTRQVQRCAADLYGLVRTVAKRVGRVDLALLAADRGIAAAEVAGDPVRRAAAHWNLAHVLLAQDQPEGAEAVALHAAENIAPHTADDLDALAVRGSLQLIAAMASVRLGKPWRARDRVRAVVPLAERTGERNVCWTAFGPTNVAIFAVSVEVEAGDTGEGLRLAERIVPEPSMSIERRVAFHLEQAKGYNQRQNYAGALVMLQAASVEAPEDLTYRPAARRALHTVVQRGRGAVGRQAAQLASRMGTTIS
ncbi:helix-turn-helix domain-containing protein [Actinophytocola algeriensis]|uniref:Transcriptional regulator with XRE-family HTH domain n=1 Tax=Actinophytocola algeriensis TaxID=1768010 RepID=A0A7W7VHM6_9PSEU|nr:helix-turn-helix transcriptional regulator [Actinophytocola algeriensis]MBB4910591.1 transcriptional regulator with XRE-family HTH domain [Actinophytocola algeriensis]MBE1480421.1 transcriptional regulator with XRE-family HTH domain [Actinophytocola algeriensis]